MEKEENNKNEQSRDINNQSCLLSSELTTKEVERYCRQMTLPEIQTSGQNKLKKAKVLVIGAGGLGSPCLMYLAGAGVGTIGIVDGDSVDTSNLHRQVIHSNKNKDINKSESAKSFIQSYNPEIVVNTFTSHFSNTTAIDIAKDYDILIDCTDNPATRYLINDVAVVLHKTLVSGSAIRWEGQLTVLIKNTIINDVLNSENKDKIINNDNKLPCYRCLFPVPSPAGSVGSCSEQGVLGPVPGVIGVLQATEAIKIILGYGDKTLSKRMLLYDAMEMKFKVFNLKGWRKECIACGVENSNFNEDYIKNFNYNEFANGKGCARLGKIELPKVNTISWKDFIAKSSKTISNNNDNIDKPIFIDCRTEPEFDIFNFSYINYKNNFNNDIVSNNTYINIPLNKITSSLSSLEDNNIINKDKSIYITCKSGVRSSNAVKFLLDNNYKNVFNIENGVLGYRKEINSDDVPYY